MVAGVACLVADRNGSETAWLAIWSFARSPSRRSVRPGPGTASVANRRWVELGLALGSKWNALYPLAAFALLSLAWDIRARSLAGAGGRAKQAILRDGIPAFFSMVVLSLVVYVGTWASWLLTSGGYDRDWGAQNPEHPR